MDNSLSHSTATVTVEDIGTNKGVPFKNPNDIDFIVKYKEGHEGRKPFPEGPLTVSKEVAEKFTQLGYGHVAGSEEPVNSTEGPDNNEAGSDGAGGNNPTANTNKPKDYSILTKELLAAELTDRQIEFPATAKKQDLIDLLVESDKALIE